MDRAVRFVTAEALALRFGVSVQASRKRVRRLEERGLLASSREHVSEAKAVWLAAGGAELLGQPRRRPPRVALAREHEQAIVLLATTVELEATMGDEMEGGQYVVTRAR